MTREDEDTIRNLVVVFADQLGEDLRGFRGFDSEKDGVLMMELEKEPTYVVQHKIRLAFFFSALRHVAQTLKSYLDFG